MHGKFSHVNVKREQKDFREKHKQQKSCSTFVQVLFTFSEWLGIRLLEKGAEIKVSASFSFVYAQSRSKAPFSGV